jgi:hypothetical protein
MGIQGLAANGRAGLEPDREWRRIIADPGHHDITWRL